MGMCELCNRVALVTGAGRGIGRAVALELAKAGADVVLVSRTEEQLREVAAEVVAMGRRAEVIVADVSQAAEVDGAVARALEVFGRIDILVNNAGITRDGLLLRMKESDWDEVLRVNLRSAYLCSKACLKTMMKCRYGRIVSVASVVGLRGNAGQCNYAASKAGLVGFTKSLAKEIASRGVTVNAVAPGFIRTAMTEQLASEAAVLREIPLGTVGTPQDVACVVRFLASEESGYITGQVINVDGGMAI